MFKSFRAGGFAAAALLLVAGFAYAGPSQALDVELQPMTSHYIDHASATIEVATPEGQAPADRGRLAHDIDFSTPVAQHAVAAVAKDVAEVTSGGKLALAALVDAHGGTELSDADMECLAGAIYFESKGEPLEGQLAVAEVVINRSESGRFPSSLCGVVKQPRQFSFVRGGRIPSIPRSSSAWRKAVAIARIARDELAESRGSQALFFHATYVSPSWRGLKRVGTIGNHVFYR